MSFFVLYYYQSENKNQCLKSNVLIGSQKAWNKTNYVT